ncbi:amidohydrolase family protein [Kocuria rhizophila]|uniref:amidohydrolase family protein n=1 Tax=Kocuria rhizophila TaxID=72000 RepID=UPI001E14F480|nr:amidohydrolase family protein [Kocuria rhizophila]MCC5673138.1 amidohydrolase family protein [Kocuria rhizophila]
MRAAQPSTRVWTNGSVYSPADPFATAILTEGPTVAWVGSDDAARAMAGPGAEVGDLRAAVVTPAFVAHCRVPDPGAPAASLPGTAQGYGAVELLGADLEALADAAARVRADGARALPVLVRAATGDADIDPSALPSPALGLELPGGHHGAELAATVRGHLQACTRAGIQAVLVLGSDASDGQGAAASQQLTGEVTGPAEDASGVVDTVLDAVAEAAERVGERAFRARGHRLVGVGALREEQCERLATLGLTLSCHAGAAPLRDLSRAGVPVTLISAQDNPWRTVKAALEAPHERLRTSARAAFLAMTRGAWRAHPGSAPLAGQLAPGAEATLAVWDAESVVVQQAQGTGASWSTDPRARTPVLPALDDSRLPRCEATVVAGELVSGQSPRP